MHRLTYQNSSRRAENIPIGLQKGLGEELRGNGFPSIGKNVKNQSYSLLLED